MVWVCGVRPVGGGLPQHMVCNCGLELCDDVVDDGPSDGFHALLCTEHSELVTHSAESTCPTGAVLFTLLYEDGLRLQGF